MATIRIPTPLRKLTQGKEEVSASGATIGALIASLETQYPGIKERICDDAGQVRRFALPEIGPEGQARIGAARVAVVGADLAAETAATYLRAAGCQVFEEMRS